MKRVMGAVTMSAVILAAVAHSADDAAKQKLVERGKYLVTMGACHDCHSPKKFTDKGMELDTARLMSGHPAGSKLPTMNKQALTPGNWVLFSPDLTAAVGPWGVSYSMNLTPDDQTGIGLWTEEIFTSALRSGKHMGAGRPILPPMPWQFYSQATDDDLKAIYAYLRSLPPIKNAVPAPVAAADVK